MGVKLIRSDLRNPTDELVSALGDVEAVIHAAARTGDWGSLKLFLRQNYEPTVRLFGESRKAGCRKFVYVSSLAVHGFGEHRNSTEEGPYYPLINPYQTTKKRAEEYILKESEGAGSHSMAAAVIRPGNVYGPGDTTTFFPIFRAMEKGLMGYLGKGDTLTCPVYIDDLVNGTLLALEEDDANGDIFNLVSDDKATWRDILEYSAKELGIRPPRIRIPRRLALGLAGLLTGIYKAFFIPLAPPITFYRVHQLTSNYHFSNSKAKEVLGYEPQTRYKTGFKQTVADYQAGKKNGK